MTPALRKRSEVPACAAVSAPRAEALARQRAQMLPHVARVRVCLQDPRTPWPHLELTATDEHGHRVRVTRTQALCAARWVIRTHPNAGWQQPHTFDLRTALLDGGEA
jgi:hypothetical protein